MEALYSTLENIQNRSRVFGKQSIEFTFSNQLILVNADLGLLSIQVGSSKFSSTNVSDLVYKIDQTIQN